MSTLKVDLDLVRKYNVPGPRYTSYPPATHFSDQAPSSIVLDKLRQQYETERDLSLYFHLPFCQSLCWFCGCTTVITTQQSKSAIYLDYLRKELSLMTQFVKPSRKAVQLHFGGGTPTFLLPDEIRALGQIIRSHFTVADDAEASVEIDPRRLTFDHLKALREIKFNRVSIGVQDNNPVVQQAIHRIQPAEQTRKVVDWIRSAGFQSLNIDLIYGLPYQTSASFEQTLNEILELKPDRLAIFSYAHVPWIKPAQRIFRPEVMPSADVKLELLKLSIEKLTSAGYVYIGMDHFAREDDELAIAQRQKTLQRNFQGYSTRGGTDVFAFGMSSISQADGVYWQNQKELGAYYGALDAGTYPIAKSYVLSDDDRIRRMTIMRLMCDLSLDLGSMSQLLGLSFTDYFSRELGNLSDLEADRLVERTPERLVVTDLGRLFIRNIAMRFDAYLGANKENRFSKTI